MTTIEILPTPDDMAFSQALDAAGTGCWEWDLPSDHLRADTRFLTALDPSWASAPDGMAERHAEVLAAIRALIITLGESQDAFLRTITSDKLQADLLQPLRLRCAIVERSADGAAVRAAGTTENLYMDAVAGDQPVPEYLKLAMDTADLGVWIWHMPTDHFHVLNEDLTPRGHISGNFPSFNQVLDIIHPDDVSIVKNAIRKVRDETSIRRGSVIYRMCMPDGSFNWMNTTVSVISRNAVTGKAETLFGINQDITEIKTAEQALDQANARLTLAMDATRLTLWEWDLPSGRFDLLNERSDVLGFNPGDEIVRSFDFFLDLVHPDDRGFMQHALSQISNRQTPRQSVTVRMRRNDNTWAWVQIMGSVSAWTQDGSPLRILGIGMDITESMEAELAARHAEQERSIILDSVREAIFHINTDMEVTWQNQNAQRIFHELMPNSDATELFSPHGCLFHAKAPCIKCVTQQVFHTGQPVDEEKEVDGRHYRLLLNPVFEPGSHAIRGCVGSILDVTEQRKMENELMHSQKMQAIGQLAGGVAHDFNNRLNSIMGFAQLLAEELSGKEPALHDFAERIVAASKRAANLTRQLLAFARKGQYRQERINLHDLIQEVILFVEHTFDKNIHIQRVLGATNPHAMGDSDQIQNVLLNLAINARDAMPEGGTLTFRSSTVRIGTQAEEEKALELEAGEYTCITIADSGTGIPPEAEPHIFEPFFTTKPVGEGTGMGLPSAYGTVKKHNGAIAYTTGPTGTEFRIYLPVDTSALRAAEAPAPYGEARGRLLVIDDDDQLLSLLSTALAKDGYSVVTAPNGTDGLKAFRHDPIGFDVVVIDMVMPDLSGVEVYEAMRRSRPAQRAIICSGYSCEDQIAQLESYPSVDFVKKPFSLQVIRDMMASALA